MTITIIVPLLVAIIGLLLYFMSTEPKRAEVGKIAFFVGLLWLVNEFAHTALHL